MDHAPGPEQPLSLSTPHHSLASEDLDRSTPLFQVLPSPTPRCSPARQNLGLAFKVHPPCTAASCASRLFALPGPAVQGGLPALGPSRTGKCTARIHLHPQLPSHPKVTTGSNKINLTSTWVKIKYVQQVGSKVPRVHVGGRTGASNGDQVQSEGIQSSPAPWALGPCWALLCPGPAGYLQGSPSSRGVPSLSPWVNGNVRWPSQPRQPGMPWERVGLSPAPRKPEGGG